MSHFLPRLAPALAAVAVSAALFGATTTSAFASRGGPDYRLVPSEAQSGNKVARDVLWRCGDAGCTASNATSRPEIVCAHAVRELGQLTSFSFRGEAFDADTLAKCNAKAR